MVVYLSGGIYKDNKEATDEWRDQARTLLHTRTIDPCRGRALYDPAVFTTEEIVTRDKLDIQKADLMLVWGNPVGEHLSIGTWMECEYAHANSRPIVLVSSDHRVRNHPWIQNYCVKVFFKIEDACTYINSFWV